jgi:transcription initiation factor IIE alpha subunit
MKLEFDLECPNCKRKMAQKVEAMRPGASRRCPSCGAEITFSGDDGRKAQKALDDLTKSLKSLSIKL